MKIVALVPMRHHSERVPGKNYRTFAGLPLYQHIIQALLGCRNIEQVILDTDSPMILQEAPKLSPAVRVIERPDHLRDDGISMNEVLLHDVAQVEADLYVQTHSTNPLLRTATIDTAIDRLLENHPAHDSLFSVTRVQTRLWDQLGRAVNHNPSTLLRTQDLPPIYEENSNLFLFSRQTLETQRNRIGLRPLMFEIDRLESWDIDEEIDFQVAEFLFKSRNTDKEVPDVVESDGVGAVHAA